MMCGGMMLLLISGAISNSNAVIRQEFRKLRFQMIDDMVSLSFPFFLLIFSSAPTKNDPLVLV